VTEFYASYEKTITRQEDRQLFEAMKAFRPDYLRLRSEVIGLSAGGQKKEAIERANNALEPHFDNYMAVVRSVVDYNKNSADENAAEMTELVSAAWHGLVFGVGVAIALGAACAWIISRGVTRVLSDLAHGIASGSDQVASAAAQVAASSQTLAGTTSEQAASLEEASSSLVEMGSVADRNSENAGKANELARQAREAADAGTSEMHAMSTAMGDIKSSSDDIAKIIKTIDEIAFQTNILALNAAVEAARAGEAGMGFAVVADEVRALAQRSAKAAKETAGQIESAIAKTAEGVQISAKVSANLAAIVAKVREVDALIADVAAASREQTQGIQQINSAVSHMDKVVQSNASTAEESASAAEELHSQSASLRESVAALSQLVGIVNETQAKTAARNVAKRASAKPVDAPRAPRSEKSRLNRRGAPQELAATVSAGENDRFFKNAV
jgi:methyl-accepting chemotaxis protein